MCIRDRLAACGKSMNDQIDRRAVEAREYQEYIETWVHEVKTPIASLLLSVEGGRQPDPAAVRREAERIDGYVEQALYYTRSGAPEKDYEMCIRDSSGGALCERRSGVKSAR